MIVKSFGTALVILGVGRKQEGTSCRKKKLYLQLRRELLSVRMK